MISRDPDDALRALTSPRQRCEEPSTNDCRGPADLEKLQYDDETDTWYECMLDQRHDQYTWVIIPAPDDGGRTGANFNDRLPSDSRFHRPRVPDPDRDFATAVERESRSANWLAAAGTSRQVVPSYGVMRS